MSLITALNRTQSNRGHLGEEDLRRVALEQRVPLHAVQAVVSFYPHFRTTPPPGARVAVCRDMACTLAGADALCAMLKKKMNAADAEVQTVSCIGRCDSAPAVAVNDIPLNGSVADRIVSVAHAPDHVASERIRLVERCWDIDPYESRGDRYGLIRRLRGGDTLDAVAVLTDSGLAGCGGAGFATGRKWQLVAQQENETKYVICNADESEPGTFKDRVVVCDLPHLVLEGMMIAARVIGAAKGYVFIRHEYEAEREQLEAEIQTARAAGFLNDSFDVEIFTSPGGYILGEETALLECMEDRRGEPRNKPPFPGQAGLYGKPTLINNVETFAAATAILHRGPGWWKSAGVNGCHGLKFISVSGDVEQPDVYLIPMGTTVLQLIDLAGGVKDGRQLKAFAPGGASSNFLPASMAQTPIDFEHLARAGSMLGSGALFVVAEGRDMVALGANVVRFFRNESCGKCVPCRLGSEKAHRMLEDMLAHGGSRAQLELLQELCDTMHQTSICGLGQVALNPILSVVKHFPEDVARYVGGDGDGGGGK